MRATLDTRVREYLTGLLSFLFIWICLTHISFFRVAKVVAPKKESLKKAEGELAVAMASLEKKRASLREVQVRIVSPLGFQQ